jgi:hypothetical protein
VSNKVSLTHVETSRIFPVPITLYQTPGEKLPLAQDSAIVDPTITLPRITLPSAGIGVFVSEQPDSSCWPDTTEFSEKRMAAKRATTIRILMVVRYYTYYVANVCALQLFNFVSKGSGDVSIPSKEKYCHI